MTTTGVGAGCGLLALLGLTIVTIGGCASVRSAASTPAPHHSISIALATGPFGALLAPMTLNETHRVWMLIDTGASTSSIDRNVARGFGLTESPSSNITVGVGGTSSSAGGIFAVRQLEVAGASYGPIDLHALDLTGLRGLEQDRGGPRTDGILGADFLAPLSAVVDYGHRRMVLIDPNADGRQFYVQGIVALAAEGAPSALTALKSWPKKILSALVGAKVSVLTAQGRLQTAQTDTQGRFKLGPITAGAFKTIRTLSVSHEDAVTYSLTEPGELLTGSRVRLLISVVPAR